VILALRPLFNFSRAQRAKTAFLAPSLRSSRVIAAALAGPTFIPSDLPKARAYGFSRCYTTNFAGNSRDTSRNHQTIWSIEEMLKAVGARTGISSFIFSLV
jgi:hypothetical protein